MATKKTTEKTTKKPAKKAVEKKPAAPKKAAPKKAAPKKAAPKKAAPKKAAPKKAAPKKAAPKKAAPKKAAPKKAAPKKAAPKKAAPKKAAPKKAAPKKAAPKKAGEKKSSVPVKKASTNTKVAPVKGASKEAVAKTGKKGDSASTMRMFKNPLLEKLSHVHPAVPFVTYIPVVLVALFFSFSKFSLAPLTVAGYFAGGALFWTMMEYLIHRFVFHPPYSDGFMKWFYFYTHGVHHELPNDATRLVMPPGASVPLAVLFYFIFKQVIGVNYLPFFAGFVTGYLIYDFLHFATHFYNFNMAWFRKLKKHHSVHHFNNPGKNFGVSNSFWDYIFFTKYN